jgi:hypothetical protein
MNELQSFSCERRFTRQAAFGQAAAHANWHGRSLLNVSLGAGV